MNVGLRTEREEVPTYTTGLDANGDQIPKFGIKFGYGDKLAPRVGAAYDLAGDGKWKAFASWGVFYDIFKLELPRGSFGGDKWIEYYYTLDTYDWPNLVPSGCPPACPGTMIRSTNFRLPSFGADSLEPNLKPMKSEEFTAGLDHELNATMAVGVHYVHKQLDRAVEDTGFLTPAGDEGYVIANPSEGLTALAFTDPNVPMPKPKRQYDSVEFYADKRFANNWSLRASYLWSRLYGNYSGLTQSDENGRTSPNVGRGYDYPAMMFDQNGDPVYGPLATDRPHQFKAQAIYQFNIGTAVGLNEYLSSGLPVTRELGILPPSNYPNQYLGRGSDGRTDKFAQTDLYIQHPFKFGGGRRLELNFTIFNLFNQEAGVSKYSTYQQTDGISFDEADFYNHKLDFNQLIAAQAHRAGSAVPAIQRVPGADLGALRREVRLLADAFDSVRGFFCPAGFGPRGFFLGRRHLCDECFFCWPSRPSLVPATLASAQPPGQTNADAERARAHYISGWQHMRRRALQRSRRTNSRRRSISTRSTSWPITASAARTWHCTNTAKPCSHSARAAICIARRPARSSMARWTPVGTGRIA